MEKMYQELFTNKYNINQIPCIFTDIEIFSIEVTEIMPSAFVNIPIFPIARQVKIQKQRQESDKKLLIGKNLSKSSRTAFIIINSTGDSLNSFKISGCSHN